MDWIISREKILTAGGIMRTTSLSIFFYWVKAAWDEIFEEIIVKSFKKCFNALDDSEDDGIGDDINISEVDFMII